MRIKYLLILSLISILSSCGAYLNQPVRVSEAKVANKTDLEKTLIDLPKPKAPVVVAVYKFKDQTGQYKPTEIGSSFSTAVTQGGTNILVKALDDSGWFKVIERENIGNLLNERKIIRQTRMQYGESENNSLLVNPLLFAGVILEGGVVSYDANVVTGGLGLRYFGSGGSTAYRQDRVTVYIRAIATKTGEVLKNVTTSKTVLSQSLDGGVFRFVKFGRLLEAETGFTFNEPADIAVTEAVQKAVFSLVVEGIKEGLWQADTTFRQETIDLINQYDSEISENDLENYLGVKMVPNAANFGVSVGPTGYFYQGDFPSPRITPGLSLGLHYELNKLIGFDFDYDLGRLEATQNVDVSFSSLTLASRLKILGGKTKNPYLKAGASTVFSRNLSQSNFSLMGGIGMEVNLNSRVVLNFYGEWNQLLNDDIDGLSSGKYVDYFYQFGAGLKYQFDFKTITK
jgi:curli production assembly/transport component CsgG